MKKIGLFTIYKAKNYGTQLQAEALYTILKKIGNTENVYVLTEENDISANPFRPFSKNPLTILKRLYYWKMHRQYLTQYQKGKFEDFYDAVVIGSDELWNVLNPDFIHSDKYVGKGFNANKKIVYAMSCNRSSSTEFVKQYGNNPFLELNSISARDNMTQTLVQEIKNERPIRVLDPTFLVDFEVAFPAERKYLMVYGYQFNENEILEIKAFAATKHLMTISIGFEHHWCDRFILCSTNEFLGYVQKAEYIVTSTFHGTVFSIKYNKPFASYVRDNCKVGDLLEHFSMQDRNASVKRLSEILEREIEYSSVNKQVDDERQMSVRWLTDVLRGRSFEQQETDIS